MQETEYRSQNPAQSQPSELTSTRGRYFRLRILSPVFCLRIPPSFMVESLTLMAAQVIFGQIVKLSSC